MKNTNRQDNLRTFKGIFYWVVISLITWIIVLSVCTSSRADTIPGFFEFDASLMYLDSRSDVAVSYYTTDLTFKYGGTFGWFKPYMFGNMQTSFVHGDSLDANYPFKDKYTYGVGFLIKNTFYVEAGHTCTHTVVSNAIDYKAMSDQLTTYAHNHIKVGINIKVD